jgi:hypothetical protein
MSFWQLIFLQSKVNNARYDGNLLISQNWDWPKETWFQRRRRDLRNIGKNSEKKLNKPGPLLVYE